MVCDRRLAYFLIVSFAQTGFLFDSRCVIHNCFLPLPRDFFFSQYINKIMEKWKLMCEFLN